MASDDCEEDLDELRAAALASLMLANAQKKAPQANAAAKRDGHVQQPRDTHAQQAARHDGSRPRVERGLLSDVSTSHGDASAPSCPRTSGFPLPVATQTRPRPDMHSSRSHHHPPTPADISSSSSSRRHNHPNRDWTAPCASRGLYVWRKPSPPQRSRDDDIIFGKTNLIVLSELGPQDDADGDEATRVASRGVSEVAATAVPSLLRPMQPTFVGIAGTAAPPVQLEPFRPDRDDRRGGPTSSHRSGSSSMHRWQRSSGGRSSNSGSGNGGRGHRESTSAAAAAAATSTKAKSSVPRRFRRLEEDSDSDDSDDSVDDSCSRHGSLSPSRSASDDEDNHQSPVCGAAAEPVSNTSCSAGGVAEPAASESNEAAAAVQAKPVLLQPGSRQNTSVDADSSSRLSVTTASGTNSTTAAVAADLRAAVQCSAAATAQKPDAAAPAAAAPAAAAAAVLPAGRRRPESNVSASVVASGAASIGGRVPPVQQQPVEASRSSDKPDIARSTQRKQLLEVAAGAPASASRRDSTKSVNATASAAASSSSKNSGTGAATHRLQRDSVPSAPSMPAARLVPAHATFTSPAASSRVASELPPRGKDVSSVTLAAARDAVDGQHVGRSKDNSVSRDASEAASAVALMNSLGQSAEPHQPAAAARLSGARVFPLNAGLSSESISVARTESGRATLQPQQHVGSTSRSDSAGSRRRGDDAGKNRSDSVGSRRRGDDAGKQSNENRVAADAATAACIAAGSGSSSSSSLGQQRPPESGGSPAAAQRRTLAERLGKRSDNSKSQDSATNAAAAGAAAAPPPPAHAAATDAANVAQKIPGAPVGVDSWAVTGDAKRHSTVAHGPAAVGDAGALLTRAPSSTVSTITSASSSTSSRTGASAADQKRQHHSSSLVRLTRISAPARPSDIGEQRAAEAAAADAGRTGCSSDPLTAARATSAVDELSQRDKTADAAHQSSAAAALPCAANPESRASCTDRDRNVSAHNAGTATVGATCDRDASSSSERSQEQQRKLEARRLKFGVAGTAQQPQTSSTPRSSSPPTSSAQKQQHQEHRAQRAKLVLPSTPTIAANVALEEVASLRSTATSRTTVSAAAAMAAANAALTQAAAAVASTSPGTKRRGERVSCESQPPVKRSPLAASGVDVRSVQPPDLAATLRSSDAPQCSVPELPPSESTRRSADDRHVIVVAASEQQSIGARPDRCRHSSTARRRSRSSSSSSSLQGDLETGGGSRSKASVLARLGHRVVKVVRYPSLPTETTSSNVSSPEVAVLLPEEGIVGRRLSDRKRSRESVADIFAEEASNRAHSASPDVSIKDSVGGGSSAKRRKQLAAERLERTVRVDALLQHAEAGCSNSSGDEPKRPSQPVEDEQPELTAELSEQSQHSPLLLPSRLVEHQQQLRSSCSSSGNSSPASSDRQRQQAEQLDSVEQRLPQLRHVQVDRRHGDGRKPSASRRRSSGGGSSSSSGKISSSSSRHANLIQRALRPDRRPSEDDSVLPLASNSAVHSRVALDESDKKRAAEAQLDERIRKIKEKNAAILQRHQMIEAEKQWTSC